MFTLLPGRYATENAARQGFSAYHKGYDAGMLAAAGEPHEPAPEYDNAMWQSGYDAAMRNT